MERKLPTILPYLPDNGMSGAKSPTTNNARLPYVATGLCACGIGGRTRILRAHTEPAGTQACRYLSETTPEPSDFPNLRSLKILRETTSVNSALPLFHHRCFAAIFSAAVRTSSRNFTGATASALSPNDNNHSAVHSNE